MFNFIIVSGNIAIEWGVMVLVSVPAAKLTVYRVRILRASPQGKERQIACYEYTVKKFIENNISR